MQSSEFLKTMETPNACLFETEWFRRIYQCGLMQSESNRNVNHFDSLEVYLEYL